MDTILENLTRPLLTFSGRQGKGVGRSRGAVRPSDASAYSQAAGSDISLAMRPSQPCSESVFYIKNPDGSLVCASVPGFMEAEAAAAQPQLPVVPATSRLRDTARALRQAVQQEIGAGMLFRATRRRMILSKLLTAELVADLFLALSTQLLPSAFVMPDGLPRFLIGLWWLYSIVYCTLGRKAVHCAQDRIYRCLSMVSFMAVMGQLLMALGVICWAHSESEDVSVHMAVPMSILADLPLRLFIGVQARMLSDELKYLLQLPADIDLA